jgi:hypothetical protein
MRERLAQELDLLKKYFPSIEYKEEGWFKIPGFALPDGWNRSVTDVAFQARPEYPGTPPYGIYVPSGIQFKGQTPTNYNDTASPQPPFGGSWGILSWSVEDGTWKATANLLSGSNLLNWARSIADRCK